MPEYEYILYEEKGPTRVITLNRPGDVERDYGADGG